MPTGGPETLSLAVVFAAIIFSFIYLGINLPGDNAMLSWVFIPIGIVFMAAGLFFVAAQGIFQEQLGEALSGIMYALIVVIIFLIAYFFIYLIYNTVRKAMPYPASKAG